MFKAIVFDIGQTLVEYNKPLNWSKLYRPALQNAADQCRLNLLEEQYQNAIAVLTKYNTRINPRIHEVSSTQIFEEILTDINLPGENMELMKFHFYSYFRQDVSLYPETEETLKTLHEKGILLGTLSDVAYGMDNKYALEDIVAVRKYIQYPFTSNDVGYRKPSAKGLQFLAEKMDVAISEMIFVGDEEKDIACAKSAGAYAVLINRNHEVKEYGQDREIACLEELLDIVNR
ncbi:MAG: HAD family hydrolase [Lachnospiraceae bacterium]|nr:HAD family hydrolase [Lachnospiraceae bacterium]